MSEFEAAIAKVRSLHVHQVGDYESKLDAERQRSSVLQDRVETLEAQLRQSQEEASGLRREVDLLQGQVSRMSEELGRLGELKKHVLQSFNLPAPSSGPARAAFGGGAAIGFTNGTARHYHTTPLGRSNTPTPMPTPAPRPRGLEPERASSAVPRFAPQPPLERFVHSARTPTPHPAYPNLRPPHHQYDRDRFHRAATPPVARSDTPHARPSPGNNDARGRDLFQAIRARVTFDQFNCFLDEVHKVSSNEQGVETMLAKLRHVFGEHNRDLVDRLRAFYAPAHS